jgi:hypothetical protein
VVIFLNLKIGISLFLSKEKQKEALLISLKLSKNQNNDGSVTGKSSICNSNGIALKIESTSIAIICWSYEYEKFSNEINKSREWLNNQRVNGLFGNSQSNLM